MPRISGAGEAEHRHRLLAAAASEFATKGLDAARVDDISVAAGLATGTIDNDFDSRIDVFRAVVEEWAWTAHSPTGPAPERAVRPAGARPPTLRHVAHPLAARVPQS